MANTPLANTSWKQKNFLTDDDLIKATRPIFTTNSIDETLDKWTLEEKLKYNYETSYLLPENDDSLSIRNASPLSTRIIVKSISRELMLIGFTIDGKTAILMDDERILTEYDPEDLKKTESDILLFKKNVEDLRKERGDTFVINNNTNTNSIEIFSTRLKISIIEKIGDFYKVKISEIDNKSFVEKASVLLRDEDIHESSYTADVITTEDKGVYNYIKKKREQYENMAKNEFEKVSIPKIPTPYISTKYLDISLPSISNQKSKEILSSIISNEIPYDSAIEKLDLKINIGLFNKIKESITISDVILYNIFKIIHYEYKATESITLKREDFPKQSIIYKNNDYIIIDKHVTPLSIIHVLVYGVIEKQVFYVSLSITNEKGDIDIKDENGKELEKIDHLSKGSVNPYQFSQANNLHYNIRFQENNDKTIHIYEIMQISLQEKIYIFIPLEISNLFKLLDYNHYYLSYITKLFNIVDSILVQERKFNSVSDLIYDTKIYRYWGEYENKFLTGDSLINEIPSIIEMTKGTLKKGFIIDTKKLDDEIKKLKNEITDKDTENKNLETKILDLEDQNILLQTQLLSTKSIPTSILIPEKKSYDENNFSDVSKRMRMIENQRIELTEKIWDAIYKDDVKTENRLEKIKKELKDEFDNLEKRKIEIWNEFINR
jgi:hypothetical protein